MSLCLHGFFQKVITQNAWNGNVYSGTALWLPSLPLPALSAFPTVEWGRNPADRRDQERLKGAARRDGTEGNRRERRERKGLKGAQWPKGRKERDNQISSLRTLHSIHSRRINSNIWFPKAAFLFLFAPVPSLRAGPFRPWFPFSSF